MPVHAPDHLSNTESESGVALRVIFAPARKALLHVVPQSIPVGLLVTVPSPSPFLVTLSVKFPDAVAGLNVAVTVTSELSVTVQIPAPVHPPPLQPENTEPLAATAVRATLVSLAKLAEHVLPQLIPVGPLVTVPVPVPFLVRLSE